MVVILLLVMAAPGLCAASSRQYYLYLENKNMTEAQSYCRDKHVDLATIDSMEDVNILMTKSTSDIQAWIGLYDASNSWRWSLPNKTFDKDGVIDFLNWAPGQPNNCLGKDHCTIMRADGYWEDYSCESTFAFICFDDRGSNVTFVRVSEAMDWSKAQWYCRKHYTDLARVSNMEENQRVKELITGTHWIGLFRDTWTWSDGSISPFRNWDVGINEPNNGGNNICVVIKLGPSEFGKWNDLSCDYKRPFICYSQITKKKVIKLRFLVKNPVDLNNPAVMERILTQLKEQGVSQDVRLSWKKQSDGKVFHKDVEETKKRRKREL